MKLIVYSLSYPTFSRPDSERRTPAQHVAGEKRQRDNIHVSYYINRTVQKRRANNLLEFKNSVVETETRLSRFSP